MSLRVLPPLALLAVAGCVDIFALPVGSDLAGLPSGGDGPTLPPDLSMTGVADLSGVPDLTGPVMLPTSCAKLSCTPASNEGTVTISSGVLSGCHAYDHLTIDQMVHATSFQACANVINIGAVIDGSGANTALGPGAGLACNGGGAASGGGHGGNGGDPNACMGGGAYGDAMHPREHGSAGGGANAGLGGAVIELAAGMINLFSIINVDGSNANGGNAGGGSGGSVLIQGSIFGTGRITANGGDAAGLAGGGGGGRVAIYAGGTAFGVSVDAHGGAGANGAVGAMGTVSKQ